MLYWPRTQEYSSESLSPVVLDFYLVLDESDFYSENSAVTVKKKAFDCVVF